IWLAEKEEREAIYQTSIRPFRKPLEKFKESIDPRMVVRYGRYGNRRDD
ncbi:phage anti-RecBCD protein, partial [Citrobacter sp. R5]